MRNKKDAKEKKNAKEKKTQEKTRIKDHHPHHHQLRNYEAGLTS